jgi:hypothetical protein
VCPARAQWKTKPPPPRFSSAGVFSSPSAGFSFGVRFVILHPGRRRAGMVEAAGATGAATSDRRSDPDGAAFCAGPTSLFVAELRRRGARGWRASAALPRASCGEGRAYGLHHRKGAGVGTELRRAARVEETALLPPVAEVVPLPSCHPVSPLTHRRSPVDPSPPEASIGVGLTGAHRLRLRYRFCFVQGMEYTDQDETKSSRTFWLGLFHDHNK